MAKVSIRKSINISRVVAKIATVIIALYVGGTIVTELGTVMNGTSNAFNKGLSLIGWTVGSTATNGTHYDPTCGAGTYTLAGDTSGITTCITSVSGSGILAVIGIIGIASIVMEFVQFKM